MWQIVVNLNCDKTRVIVGSKAQKEKLTLKLNILQFNQSREAKNLKVIFIRILISSFMCGASQKQLFITWSTSSKWSHFSLCITQRLMYSLITHRIDVCNSLLSGLLKNIINWLQLIQNFAAWVLTKTKRRAHIVPILKSSHCFLDIVFVLILKIFY